ncbi:MAG: ABC transporter permease [Planctomycetota bacterium]|nr:ABC transporter permease [Planctomycetota bacterium]
MSGPAVLGRPSRGTVLWTVAAAILVHAIVLRLAGERVLGTTALLGFLLGTLPLLSGLGGRALPAALLEPLLGGLATTAAAVLADFALAPLASASEGSVPLHALLLLAVAAAAWLEPGAARRLGTLIGVEWLKLSRGRLLRVGLGVAGAVTLLVSLTHQPVKEETTGWTQAATSIGVGFWTAEILLFVIGATAIAGEISQGTMKMVLPHAYRRAEWISAKAIVLLAAAALFGLVVGLVGVGHTALDMGLDDVTREAPAGFGEEDTIEVFETAAVMRGRLLETALGSVASLAASALVGLLLSCVFHGLVPALSASFLVFAAIKTGKAFLGLAPSTLALIYAHYPDELRRLTEQFGRAVNDSWDESLLPDGLHLAMLTGGVALLAALRLFGRRDLHG